MLGYFIARKRGPFRLPVIVGATFAAEALVLSGCATTYVPSSAASSFNQLATNAGTGLQQAIAAVQAVQTQDKISEFAKGSDNKLRDLDVSPALSDAIAKEITGQFATLVSYSTALKAVTSPGADTAKSVTDFSTAQQHVVTDTANLATAIGESKLLSAAQAQKLNAASGSLASAFSTAAQGMVTIYGEEAAYRIAHETDGAVQTYCKALELLLDDRSGGRMTGLRAILDAAVKSQAAFYAALFVDLKMPQDVTDPSYPARYQARVEAINQYTALEKTGLDDAAKIDALVKAIRGIASAHEALANRKPEDFFRRVKDTQELLKSAFGSSAKAATPAAAPTAASPAAASPTTP